MKIKFVKDGYGQKTGAEIEVTEAEAKSFGDYVVEVKADIVADAVKAFEVKASEVGTALTEKFSDEVAAKALEKIGKGLSGKGSITVSDANVLSDPKGGFKSLGHFALAVKASQVGHGVSDALKPWVAKAAATPTQTGGATADGAALLPPGFAPNVVDPVSASDSLLPFCNQMPISTRTMSIPVAKHYDFSNTTATAGVVASYVSEGSARTLSKAQFETLSLTLKSLCALVATTEELEEDAIALAAHLDSEGKRQIAEGVTNNILNTVSGGVTPIIGHASVKKQVRAVASQVAFADVLKMRSKFHGNYGNAVWVANPDVLPQLGNLTSGNQNIYTPAGVKDDPFDRLMGRPLIFSQYAPALGSEGDIGLYDFSKYQVVYKASGIDTASSMHLYFDALQNVYRFVWRWDAKPQLTTVVTRADGTTASPFVVLDDATS